MTARPALLLPADLGDEIVRNSLSWARRDALNTRESGWAATPEMIEYFKGKLTVAWIYLRADRDLVMAAENEIRFLLGDYLTQRISRRALEEV